MVGKAFTGSRRTSEAEGHTSSATVAARPRRSARTRLPLPGPAGPVRRADGVSSRVEPLPPPTVRLLRRRTPGGNGPPGDQRFCLVRGLVSGPLLATVSSELESSSLGRHDGAPRPSPTSLEESWGRGGSEVEPLPSPPNPVAPPLPPVINLTL